jgi:glutathione synthase
MRIAVQMDPIDTMVVERDTSLALMIEAQGRGFEVWWFKPDDLFFERGAIGMVADRVSLSSNRPKHYERLETVVCQSSEFDVILIRQDPPFDMGYVSNTYLLELVDPSHTLVINRPRGIRNIPEKLSTLQFRDLIPPTFVGRNSTCIRAFAQEFDQVVLKPAFLAGGEGVIKSSASDAEFEERLAEFLKQAGNEPIVVQEYLPAVLQGDKRIFVTAASRRRFSRQFTRGRAPCRGGA